MPASTTSPASVPPPSRRPVWERWTKVWHAMFYISLALPTILALSSPDLNTPSLLRLSAPLILGLSLALGAWYTLIMVWLLPRSHYKRQTIWTLVYLVGAFALWFPLSRTHWAYYITASSLYGLMWGTLPFGLAVVGNIILTGLIIGSQALNMGKPVSLSVDILIIGAVTVGWAALMALWIRSIVRESAGRKRLIEQLEATQRDLAAAERQAGILHERQRLSQEIHDTLAQGFTSIVMQLEAADQALPEDLTDVRKRVLQARDTARASLAEARRLVQALRPAPLEGAELPDALRREAERWMGETGIKTDFTVTGAPSSLHPEVEVTLLRAMQEAMTNIHKHARARQVSVTLSYMIDQVALDVQDDGLGFDPADPLSAQEQVGEGYGLQAMRERVSQLGGEVIVESSPGQGTTLAVQIPIRLEIAQ